MMRGAVAHVRSALRLATAVAANSGSRLFMVSALGARNRAAGLAAVCMARRKKKRSGGKKGGGGHGHFSSRRIKPATRDSPPWARCAAQAGLHGFALLHNAP
jgi:hypothetical protein